MPDAPLEQLPRFIPPMLATTGQLPADDRAWTAEVKFDGIRTSVRYDGRRVCVRSRPGRDCTDEFPELAELAGPLNRRRVILDGELVCLDRHGKPNFAAIRARLGRRLARHEHGPPVCLMVFDVLHLDGRAVRQLPYAMRRELLAGLALDGPAWRTPRHFVGQAEELLAATAEQQLEGIVIKRLDAAYREGRSRCWIKIKHRRRERLAVTGWRDRDGQPTEFLLGRRAGDGTLRPAGSASLGLNATQRQTLLHTLATLELPRRSRSRTRWVAPNVEVLVDAHGSATGPVRDPIIRAFDTGPDPLLVGTSSQRSR